MAPPPPPGPLPQVERNPVGDETGLGSAGWQRLTKKKKLTPSAEIARQIAITSSKLVFLWVN
eukprot:7741277-Prorocentrum_lima.AAC.1